MKRIFVTAALVAATLSPAFAGTNVGVSIGINQPGVYGRIDIGNMPPPMVVYSQPIIIAPSPVAVYQQPIYLYVPPVQQSNWRRYCGRYGACGQPVYFVRDSWVRERYHSEHGRPYDNRAYQGRDQQRGEHGNRDGEHGNRDGERGNRGGDHGNRGGDQGNRGGDHHGD